MGALNKIKDFFAATGETNFEEEFVDGYDYPDMGRDITPIHEGRKGDTIALTPKKAVSKIENEFENVASGSLSKIILSSPKSIDEASTVADMLADGKTILICLDDISYEDSVRIVDFLSGSVYSSKGAITQTQKRNFLVTPRGVEVTEQHKEQLKASGISAAFRTTFSRRS